MKSLSLCAASLVAVLSCAFSIPSLDQRQANGAQSTSAFRRRGYHSSAVLDGWVYIDGASTLLAIDLSSDWTNSSVSIHSSTKPAGAPDVAQAGIWVDEDQKLLYTGFGGRRSTFGNGASQATGLWSFKPDGQGAGTWTNLNSTADTAFQSQPRPFSALVASGGGIGYMLGGFAVNASSADPRDDAITLSGMIAYNFTTKKAVNNTVSGVSTKGIDQMGAMHYVPNFGPEGILLSIGGDQFGIKKAGSDALVSMATVQIFDPASGQWYEQPVTGNVPEARKEFCITGAASNNKTYEIFLYAGWDGSLGAQAIPFDEVFVLTLPGFNWVKASYPALNPRHALTCNAIGGGQILTIGGVNTTQNGPTNLYNDVFDTPDQFIQGLGVFDLNTLSWKTSYSSKQTTYTPSQAIQVFYDNNARTPTFSSTGLQSLMAVQNFTATATSSSASGSSTSTSSSSGASSASSSSKSTSHTGAIVGGIIGGLLGLGLLCGLALFFLRRKRNAAKSPKELAASELSGQENEKYEMPGTSAGEMAAGPVDAKYMAASPNKSPAPPQYELPSEEPRHELA